MMHNSTVPVGIVGASGYGGAELVRLLEAHPVFDLAVATGGEQAGRPLREVAPQVDSDLVLAPSRSEELDGCAVVFLAAPHGVSLALAPALVSAGATVIDLSGAFRLDPEQFTAWYGEEHTAPELAPAPYGLPELFVDDLAGARLIANPGCYPTAALLALAPLASLVDPASVHIAGMSGTSGAGKGLRDDLHVSHALGNAAAYGAPRHRHTPEIERGWQRLTGVPAPVTFTPHLVPMTRGLLCTVTAQLAADVDPEAVTAHLTKTFQGQPFVRVTESWPSTSHLRGSNAAAVAAAVDERTGRVTASCAIDNLGKGAAGQAVQNANIAVGLQQRTGLTATGVYP